MIVKKNFRRQGIGLALFAEVERILIKKGCSQVLLVTERNRKGARFFYESAGFSGKTHTGFKKKLAITGKKRDSPYMYTDTYSFVTIRNC